MSGQATQAESLKNICIPPLPCYQSNSLECYRAQQTSNNGLGDHLISATRFFLVVALDGLRNRKS